MSKSGWGSLPPFYRYALSHHSGYVVEQEEKFSYSSGILK